METTEKTAITVTALVAAPIKKVWELWVSPGHIVNWNNASPDWHTPSAENDLRAGGAFSYRMEARDGSFGFDFGGVYDEVVEDRLIKYTLGDGRKVEVLFAAGAGSTKITETFEAERVNPVEMQRGGWQAILDSFKNYAEQAN